MADITEQATQDELADSLISDPEPQPQETQTEDAEPEQELAPDGNEPEAEEAADDWLPTEQEKVFPEDVLARYATRYNVDLAKADPQVRQLIVDKINSDIYLQQLRQQQQEEEEQPEPEQEIQPEPIQAQPQLTFDQHIQQLQQAVKAQTSPEMANWVYNNFMKAFGVPDADIAALSSQQAIPFVETLSVGMINLLNTFAPQFFGTYMPQVMEQQFPEFSGMYNRSASAAAWDSVRNEVQNAELPAWGTREFSTAARQIGAEIAGSAERFENMTFTDNHGKALSASANRSEKLRMIAERMANGGGQAPQIPPALMAQAVQTGQKAALRKQTQQAAGNLGNGKSRTQTVQADKDDIFGEGIELYNREHGHL